MHNLTILVGMDDTIEGLTDAWVSYLNDKYGTDVKKSDITEWNFSSAFPTISKQNVYDALHDVDLWKRVKPLPGAVKYLRKLVDDGNDVYIVTASHPDTVGMKTREVLFKYFPFIDYQHLIIASNKKMVSGDIIVDDATHNFGGTKIGLLFSAPHNMSVTDNELAELGAVRVDGWKETYELIRGYQKNNKN